MDYRVRWQQRRRRRRQKQLLVIPAALLVVVLIYLLIGLLPARRGRAYWIHDEPGHQIPRFTVGPSRVYVLWTDGHVVALHQRDGQSVTPGPLFSRPEAYNASPLLARRVLYFGSDLGLLHAIDAQSGQGLWEFDAGAPIRYQPQIAGDRLFVGSLGGKVYCFDLNGKKLWAAETGAPLSGQGALIGPALIVATTRGELWALEQATGRVLWRQDLAVPLLSPVVSADPYVLVGSDTGRFYVRQAANGGAVKSYYTAGLVRHPAAVGTDAIYFGSTDGWLRVISRDGNTPRWAYYVGGPVTVGPVVCGPYVYVGRAGRLVALNATTGRVVHSWRGEQFAGDLVVSNDTLYVGTSTGRLLALAAP